MLPFVNASVLVVQGNTFERTLSSDNQYKGNPLSKLKKHPRISEKQNMQNVPLCQVIVSLGLISTR